MFRVRFCLHVVGLFLLSVLFGLKVSRSGGVEGLYMYFTSWMWTLALLFFSFVSGCIVCPKAWDLFCYFGVSFTHGVCWMVYILFCAVVLSNSEIMEQMTHTYSFGTVFVGEKITHAFPLLAVLVTIGVYLDRLRQVPNPFTHPVMYKRVLLALYWYLAPLTFIGIYAACFDPWQVYRSKLTFAESLAVCCVTLGISQTLLLVVLFYFRRDNKPSYSMIR